MYIQARAEDFQIGVAITIYAREAPHLNFLAPHLFLAFRCGAKEIYVVEVIRLIEVKEIACLQ